MTLERLRGICLSFPHATEQIQWVDDLVFKIGGKMFAVVCLLEHSRTVAFKCTPEEFGALTEMEGIIPAPYMARASWVRAADFDTLPAAELKGLIGDSYNLVRAGLPKKVQAGLGVETDSGGGKRAKS